jgi:predicted nucleic acid-binding protein
LIVADASVALKWFKDEAGSDGARALLLREPLVAPELILPEMLNASWKSVRLGSMVPAQL